MTEQGGSEKNSDKVIADLCRENFELKAQVKEFKEAIQGISGILFCIGGSLNDNVKQFSKDQLHTFWRIRDRIVGLE